MKVHTLVLAGASLLMLASSASASGWYIGLGGGWHSMATTDVTVRNGSSAATTSTSFDDTYRLAVTGGYAVGQYRIEGEFNYTRPSLNKADAHSVGFDSLNIQEGTFMVNGLYDFPMSDKWALTAGIGVGMAGMDLNYTVGGTKLSTDVSAFCWQMILGTSVKVNDRTTLQFDYRFSNLRDVNFKMTSSSVLTTASAPSHNIMVSLRYALGE